MDVNSIFHVSYFDHSFVNNIQIDSSQLYVEEHKAEVKDNFLESNLTPSG